MADHRKHAGMDGSHRHTKAVEESIVLMKHQTLPDSTVTFLLDGIPMAMNQGYVVVTGN